MMQAFTPKIGEIFTCFKPSPSTSSPITICARITMAPNRGSTSKQGAGKTSTKGGSKGSGKSVSNGSTFKNRISKSKAKAPPPKQQKTKSVQGAVKKKRKVYTEKELGLPKLNMITPVGVEKPRGKKKGKVFVDDRVRTS